MKVAFWPRWPRWIYRSIANLIYLLKSRLLYGQWFEVGQLGQTGVFTRGSGTEGKGMRLWRRFEFRQKKRGLAMSKRPAIASDCAVRACMDRGTQGPPQRVLGKPLTATPLSPMCH